MDLKALRQRKNLKIRFSDRRTPKGEADGRRLPVPCDIICHVTIISLLVVFQKAFMEAVVDLHGNI